jgi:hypothetical protein
LRADFPSQVMGAAVDLHIAIKRIGRNAGWAALDHLGRRLQESQLPRLAVAQQQLQRFLTVQPERDERRPGPSLEHLACLVSGKAEAGKRQGGHRRQSTQKVATRFHGQSQDARLIAAVGSVTVDRTRCPVLSATRLNSP